MNFWEANPDKLAELPELAQTMTAGAIAAQWGVTRNTISGKMDRLGIRRPNGQPRTRAVRSTPFRPQSKPNAGAVVLKPLIRSGEGDPVVRQDFSRPGSSEKWSDRFNAADGMKIYDRCDATMPHQAPTEPVERRSRYAVDIWGLRDDRCHWPLFEGDEPISQKLYCGDVAIEGLPYCGCHARIAYTGARG